MLVLKRMPGETIEIGPDLEVTLVRARPEYARLKLCLSGRNVWMNVQIGQSVLIGHAAHDVEIKMAHYMSGQGGGARLAISAPPDVSILRGELAATLREGKA